MFLAHLYLLHLQTRPNVTTTQDCKQDEGCKAPRKLEAGTLFGCDVGVEVLPTLVSGPFYAGESSSKIGKDFMLHIGSGGVRANEELPHPK